MTLEDRVDALLKELASFKRKGKPADDEDRENRLAFADQHLDFVEMTAAADKLPNKCLQLKLAWNQFLTMSGIVFRTDQSPGRNRRSKPAEIESKETYTIPPLNLETEKDVITRPEQDDKIDARLAQQRLSVLLPKYLAYRRRVDGDGRAEDNAAPIVQFAIKLLDDPSLDQLHSDKLLKFRTELSAIPTAFGFGISERDLHTRWKIAKECNFTRTAQDGEVKKLKRISKSTLQNRYGAGLRAFWAWVAGLDASLNKDPPDFSAETKTNPGKKQRDAFRLEELTRLVSMPLFQGCKRPPLIWQPGPYFVQNFFYWCVLISLLAGLRPGEISQLRCRDILDLYGKPHFRFAHFSGSDDQDDDEEDRPGGNQGKSDASFRWVPVHPLLIRLGIIDRRDAIINAYVSSKASNRKRAKLSASWMQPKINGFFLIGKSTSRKMGASCGLSRLPKLGGT